MESNIKRPIIHDKEGWRIVLLEYRSQLLERLIAEFPEVLTTQKSKVEFWRTRLRVRQ